MPMEPLAIFSTRFPIQIEVPASETVIYTKRSLLRRARSQTANTTIEYRLRPEDYVSSEAIYISEKIKRRTG
jgi:hypothetical protein